MKNRPFLLVAALAVFTSQLLYAEDNPSSHRRGLSLPPIIVTPSRIPEGKTLRSVSYIQKSDFDSAFGSSITDYVRSLPSADIRRRSVSGVQADLNVRGSTFEQTAVLINGVRVNDPQTGHHTMDIPFTSMDLERMALLKGGGSALYGPDAFGGVLNIITERPGERKVHAEFSAGRHDYMQGGVSVT